MVGRVGERGADGGADGGAAGEPTPVYLEYGLSIGEQDFLEWVRRVAADLSDVEPVHGAVNRPLVKRMGEQSLLRRLFGGDHGPNRRVTPRPCSCACSARDWPRSAPRPRPRWPSKGSAPTRSSSPGRRPPATAGCRASRVARRPRLRALGARRRLGCRRPHPRGTPGRRRLDPAPHQDLDLQRTRRRRLHRLRPVRRRARRRAESPRSRSPATARAERGAARHGRATRSLGTPCPFRRRPGLAGRRAR